MAERREQEAGTSPPSMDRRTRRQPLDQWGGEISRKFMISCCHHQQRSHRAIVYSHRASLLQYSGWFENIAVQHSHKSYKCTENYAQQTQHYDERQCMTKTTFLNNSVSRQNCAPQDDSGGCLGGLLHKSVQIQNVLKTPRGGGFVKSLLFPYTTSRERRSQRSESSHRAVVQYSCCW